MTAIVLRGDAASLPLPDRCVDLIVTSPPYYGLRSYTDGGEHYAGQIGSEATPAEYVAALAACTGEWVRVLKPSGSLFVNLGDKYSGAQQQSHGMQSATSSAEYWRRTDPKRTGIPAKSLMGLPWRYALAVTDQLGLILRAEIIWAKPNGLPESVTDRVRRSHEQWFHFTVQPRYYSAVDEIREPHQPQSIGRIRYEFTSMQDADRYAAIGHAHTGRKDQQLHPLGKLPGSVWTIPSQPLTVPPELGVDHFAAFPMELPRRIISGWSPPGICVACGEGRRPVTDACRTIDGAPIAGLGAWKRGRGQVAGIGNYRFGTERQHLGYACACTNVDDPDWTCYYCHHQPDDPRYDDAAPIACDCSCHGDAPRSPVPPTRPAVVLDPFGGTGTTALIADALGRTGITIDRSWDYTRLARWRTTDPAQRAQALQVPKPPVEIGGQLDMFDEAL